MEEENKKKNSKIILVIVILLVLGGAGLTYAYFQTSKSFENVFKTGEYGTTVTEVFEAPDDWMPGDETSKTITAKNTGQVCEKVRVSYTEKWTNASGGELPLEKNGMRLSIINFDNQTEWIKDGNYYYYYKDLQAGETTSSFIKSVTFNPEYEGSLECDTEGQVQRCQPAADSYEGGQYKLTLTVDTVQCDKYKEAWNLDHDIPANAP